MTPTFCCGAGLLPARRFQLKFPFDLGAGVAGLRRHCAKLRPAQRGQAGSGTDTQTAGQRKLQNQAEQFCGVQLSSSWLPLRTAYREGDSDDPVSDHPVGCVAGRSVLKSNADEIALPPNHAAFANGVKIVEGQFEVHRQQVQVVEFNSGAAVGDIVYTAGEDTSLGVKEQQRAF